MHQTYGVSFEEIFTRYPNLNRKLIENLEEKHKSLSKKKLEVNFHKPTHSKCYETLTLESTVVHLEEFEDKLLVVLEETPFYPQGGGQEGDKGLIKWKNEVLQVENTVKQPLSNNNAIIIHICQKNSKLQINEKVLLEVNENWRKSHARSHSCTHLVGEYLMRKWGYEQKGSFAGEDYWRLDLSSNNPIKIDQIQEAIHWAEKAIKEKATKIVKEEQFEQIFIQNNNDNFDQPLFLEGRTPFGKVRVVSFKGYSNQLCGGTHVENANEIGKN